MTTRTRPTPRQRLQGLTATVAIALLVLGIPILLVAIGATPWNQTLDGSQGLGGIRDVLSRPDDGTLALLVFAVAAWIAWAVATTMLVVEAVALIGGRQSPTLPGLSYPQRGARYLVTIAALLFVAAPTVIAALPTPSARAATTPAINSAAATNRASTPLAERAPTHAHASNSPASQVPEQHTTKYVVRQGDSLWKVADRFLGDGARYTELVDLNRDALHGRPDFITPGTVLLVPADAPELQVDHPHSAVEQYVVEPGDTLSQIAADELGDPARYPELLASSSETLQPDGRRLTDPNLIRPGWQINIPGPIRNNAQRAPQNGRHVRLAPHGTTPPSSAVNAPSPSPTATESAAEPNRPPAATPGTAASDDHGASVAPWLLPGLTGGGALLAGAVLITVRAHRRTQQRHRLPGFAVAAPPDEVRSAEKTAAVAGAPTADAIAHLDRLLRHLATTFPTLLRLDAIELGYDSATLHLAEPADLPEPWQGTEATWVASFDSPVGEEDQLPPYPLLASIGADTAGHLWLLNLERLGSVSLVGDDEHVRGLARHLAAELALSPWSVVAEVDTFNVAGELANLDHGRLHHHPGGDTGFLAQLHKELDQAQQLGIDDPEPFHVLIAAGAPPEPFRALSELVSAAQSRSGFALVTVQAPNETGQEVVGSVIELTADGRLIVPSLGLDLVAAGLTAGEAEACSAIVDLTREAAGVPVPHHQEATGWRALADQAGALLSDLTVPRPLGAAGPESLLPDTTQRYEAVASTTAEDIEVLAPLVAETTRNAVEDADPQLDQDLADWNDQESSLPKLRLLGPVTVIAKGAAPSAVEERRAYFTELVTFLALHPSGVSSMQVREAFGISQSRARTDLSYIRSWFGTNPRTGTLHLPAATTSPAHRDRGTNGYQLNDVLVDLDLFRRLRARGQARGADGISDLVSALELVTGEPFSVLRNPGWSWLLDDERVHETAALAVVDVAHIVATEAFSRGDITTAMLAAKTGCTAAPYDEVCRLDLAKATKAEGHEALADQILGEYVFNRTDDNLPPIDIPDRTSKVVENNGWGRAKRS